MKTYYGFEVKLRLSGDVKKDSAVNAVKEFVKNMPETPHNIKIIAFALMGHGNENDW